MVNLLWFKRSWFGEIIGKTYGDGNGFPQHRVYKILGKQGFESENPDERFDLDEPGWLVYAYTRHF